MKLTHLNLVSGKKIYEQKRGERCYSRSLVIIQQKSVNATKGVKEEEPDDNIQPDQLVDTPLPPTRGFALTSFHSEMATKIPVQRIAYRTKSLMMPVMRFPLAISGIWSIFVMVIFMAR